MTVADSDLAETFNKSLSLPVICSCYCRQTHNGIHWCPDIMGHIERNLFSHDLRFLGGLQALSCLTGFNSAFFSCVTSILQQCLSRSFILPFQGNIRSDFISLFHPGCNTQTYKYHFHFSAFSNIIQALVDIYSFQWFQCLIFQEPASENQ